MTKSHPAKPTECFKPNAAVMRAETPSRNPGYVGAVALRPTGNPATDAFGDAKVIRRFVTAPVSKRTVKLDGVRYKSARM